MPRKPKTIPGPSHLSKVLRVLNAKPRLELSHLQSLKLTLAQKNDHFGARHFLKTELPRIRYANPALHIEVQKVKKTAAEAWRPELELHFADGNHRILNLHDKWSTVIVKELMDLAGGPRWAEWKAETEASGLPLIPGEENEPAAGKLQNISPPSLKTFLATQPPPEPPALRQDRKVYEKIRVVAKETSVEAVKAAENTEPLPESRGPKPTSGPGAVLPWD